MIKEKIITTTVYVVSDGTTFDTKQLAEEYEAKKIKKCINELQAVLKSQGVTTNNARQQSRALVKKYFEKINLFKVLERHNLTIEDKPLLDYPSTRSL